MSVGTARLETLPSVVTLVRNNSLIYPKGPLPEPEGGSPIVQTARARAQTERTTDTFSQYKFQFLERFPAVRLSYPRAPPGDPTHRARASRDPPATGRDGLTHHIIVLVGEVEEGEEEASPGKR